MYQTDMEFIDFKHKHPNTIHCHRQKFMGKNSHRHAYYEIELVVNGSGTHIINGNAYVERTGDIFIMRLTDFHKFIHTKETENWVIEIPASYVSGDIANIMMQVNGDITINLPSEDFKKAKTIYCMIEDIKDKKESFYNLLKQHLTSSLILFILNQIDNNISKSKINDDRLCSIIEYINANISSPDLSINSIASKFYISRNYLSAFFKKNMGITLGAYLRKIRLSNAAMQLVSTNKNVTEISLDSGFNSVATFLREFKKEYGTSPGDMRFNSG